MSKYIIPRDPYRFWSKVNKDGPTMSHMKSQCWLWFASKDRYGYGRFRIGAKKYKSHQVAWMIQNGAISHNRSTHGVCVCHRCDNPTCVNPEHLFLGTNADNVRDRDAKHRLRVSFGSAHHLSKLADADIITIRSIYSAGGITMAAIAHLFGVTQPAISCIINRKTWKHIK